MAKRTPFYQAHLQAQAKIVDFAGWDMPLHYGSQIQEHHQVRQHAGLFDVSHMGIVDIQGKKVVDYLRFLLANDVNRLIPGKALYTCMLNEKGGVIDDLIVYKISDDFFRLVINAGTREKDIAWMQDHAAAFNVTLTERLDLVMLALQGPEVKDKLSHFFTPHEYELIQQLKPFTFIIINDNLIARTGYTGEDGFEIIFPADQAENYWQHFVSLGILPCGLGARDTLRLEAGLNLYGNDMDETVTPLESGLGWTVALEPNERNFIGKQALLHQKMEGIKKRFVGLVLTGPGIIRHHQKILIEGKEAGCITSGGYSPTLEKSIGLARVSKEMGEDCFVEIRNKPILAKIVKPPFVRHGKKIYE